MRKLISVGVLAGSLLLFGTGSAMAQGGFGDPLSLAASGVLIPFITGGPFGAVSLIEVASPAGPNNAAPGATHMFFYNATCTRIGVSTGLPLTANDIGFVDPLTSVPAGTVNGLVAIGGVDGSGLSLIPLQNPIHSRVYVFDTVDGRGRVLEPITLSFGELTGLAPILEWNPLRTGATFYAPQEAGSVRTRLTLICPTSDIQGSAAVPAFEAFPVTRFPTILPAFHLFGTSSNMFGRVYDTTEFFIHDYRFTCNCLTDVSVDDIDANHAASYDSALYPAGTYSEITTDSSVAPFINSPFTGYRSVFSSLNPLNNFFGRLSNANKISLQDGGPITSGR